MSEIYRVNTKDIIGGPGRLIVKPYDGIFPAKISDVMDVTAPYNLKPSYRDLGATMEGIELKRGFEEEGFEVDQVAGEVDSEITAYEHGLETQLAENTLENRQLAMAGGTIIETPHTLGVEAALANDLSAQATVITLSTENSELKAGGWLKIGTEVKRINKVSGTSVYLATPLENAYTALTDKVYPITELGTRRIGFGTVDSVPEMTYVLISQKKDGTLYMCVIRKAKISGDKKTQSFNKEKRTIPLQLKAFPVDDPSVPKDENVYYEIEQYL